VKAVRAEVKSSGFDTKIMRLVLHFKKKDRQERQKEEELLGLFGRVAERQMEPQLITGDEVLIDTPQSLLLGRIEAAFRSLR
jgi:hypothetical protein